MSATKTVNKDAKEKPEGLFGAIEHFLSSREKVIFWTIFIIHALLCLFCFDPRLTGANDDANYIRQGFNYAQDFTGFYYTSQAPLYPMFLALPIAMFGINVILLKLTSVIFTLLFFYITYISLKNKIPYTILIPVMLITATNHYFLYYSTHTFVEAFYMAIQSIFFLYFFKLTDKEEGITRKWLDNWKLWLLVSFLALLLLLAKNAAYAIVPSFILYFLIRKQYKLILVSVASFLIVFISWSVVKRVVWGSNASSTESQLSILRQKDAYDKSKGYDDFNGFVERFFDNTQIYVSNRLTEILNIKSENTQGISKAQSNMGYHPLNETNQEKMPIIVSVRVTWIILLLIFYGLFWVIKNKNKELLFIASYSFGILGLSFIILQPFWAQHRYMYIFVPYFLAIIFYGFYCTFLKVKALQFVVPLLYIVLFFSGLSLIDAKVKKQGKILSAAFQAAGETNSSMSPYKACIKLSSSLFKGDKYAGYTPDWANYLKMSEWISKNIPDSDVVAMRKPAEAFIYSNGREFYGCYQVPSDNADTTLKIFKGGHIRYAVAAELRLNPESNNGQFINTVHRTLEPIATKYPGKLKLIRTEGTSEPAQLYQILE